MRSEKAQQKPSQSTLAKCVGAFLKQLSKIWAGSSLRTHEFSSVVEQGYGIVSLRPS
jgi:hypothetical protein